MDRAFARRPISCASTGLTAQSSDRPTLSNRFRSRPRDGMIGEQVVADCRFLPKPIRTAAMCRLRIHRAALSKGNPMTYGSNADRRHFLQASLGAAGVAVTGFPLANSARSEENTSELQPLIRISYAVLCLQ